MEALGDDLLGTVQYGREHARIIVQPIGDDPTLRDFQVESGLDKVAGNLEQLHRQRHQLLGWQRIIAVAWGLVALVIAFLYAPLRLASIPPLRSPMPSMASTSGAAGSRRDLL